MTKYQRPSKGLRRYELSLEKENNVGDIPPIGFEMRTDGGAAGITSATFTRIDPSKLQSAAESVMVDRIATLMMSSNEAMTVKTIADMCDGSESSVRATLNANKDSTFERVGAGRKGLWRLVDDYGTDDGYQPPLEEPAVDDDWNGEVF